MPQIFVTTGDSLFRFDKHAGQWRGTADLVGSGVRCLAVDLHRSQIMYVGSRGQGVFRSADGGRQWEKVNFPQPDVFSVAVSAADGAVYAGCEPSMLFRSRDDGASWEELPALREVPSAPMWSYPPRPWTSHVRWIASCPDDAGLLLVGIELGGIMISRDGGQSFADHPPGAQKDVHCLAWHPSVAGRAYETGGGGTAWSRDYGRTWQAADAGRNRRYCWGLAVDPADPNCWYVSAAPGPRNAHSGGDAQAGIFRWRGAGPWELLSGGLPQPLDHFPYALLCPRSGFLLAGLGDGSVFESQNGGDDWIRMEVAGERPGHITAMVWLE
jgi:photosystem II stability/assembly factor-like uncharacterized protein